VSDEEALENAPAQQPLFLHCKGCMTQASRAEEAGEDNQHWRWASSRLAAFLAEDFLLVECPHHGPVATFSVVGQQNRKERLRCKTCLEDADQAKEAGESEESEVMAWASGLLKSILEGSLLQVTCDRHGQVDTFSVLVMSPTGEARCGMCHDD
jgi:hypothetical protein